MMEFLITHKAPNRSTLELCRELIGERGVSQDAQVPLRKVPALSSNNKASLLHSLLVAVRSYLENEQLLHGLSPTLPWEASELLGFLFFFFFSGIRSVLESITFQEAVLLNVFGVSTKYFSLLTENHSFPSTSPGGLCSSLPGRCLDPSRTSSRS